MIDFIYHYPPELMNLLIQTIPLLNKSKKDVILFFKGAGIKQNLLGDLENIVNVKPGEIYKHDIVRKVLTRINKEGDATLAERREVLRRVVEFEIFSACWPNDQLKAKGLVAEIRSLVNVKDSFTKMSIEREKERQKNQARYQEELQIQVKRKQNVQDLYKELSLLFFETDVYKRSKSLESILNRLFKLFDISIRDPFTLKGSENEGIVEQIDGVIELDGEIYLVEMKWYTKSIGQQEISEHLVRVFSRSDARGIFISASDYTQPAISTCKDALRQKVIILCGLREIVLALERELDIKQMLKDKIRAAIIDKNPFLHSF